MCNASFGLRACLKIVNTPKQQAFFRHTALNFLAIRQDACKNLPCLAKKFLAVGHIANYQTSPSMARPTGHTSCFFLFDSDCTPGAGKCKEEN
jgi:hypothetical protein